MCCGLNGGKWRALFSAWCVGVFSLFSYLFFSFNFQTALTHNVVYVNLFSTLHYSPPFQLCANV
jgi:hypothetical protein